MAVLFAATVAAMAVLWPRPGELPDKRHFVDPTAEDVSGVVVAVAPAADGGRLTIRIDGSGETATVVCDTVVPAADFRPGDRVRALRFPTTASTPPEIRDSYVYLETHRGWPLLGLAAALVAIVVAVARLKGLAALVGLVGALLIVWLFTLPALLAGRHPLAVGLVTASAVMFTVVYLAHGISVKTTTALLGTLAGVAAVAALAWWSIPATHLTPLTHDDLGQLHWAVPGLDVKGILLCGMVLAGVGVLNDVTITQASAVWELRAAAPTASRRTVFAHAMRIGRDHIASTVYTIAFAYVGSALGLLTLAATLDHAVLDLLTFEAVASEIVPILVASIGLVLVIPLTTAIGAWLCGRPRQGLDGEGAQGSGALAGAAA
jgi:uncharacterized membrane protein